MTEKKKEKKDNKYIDDPEKPTIKIMIDGQELKARYRKFKSGKTGYGSYGTIKVNGWPCRLSLNLIEM